MSRLSSMTAYISVNKEDDKSPCFMGDQGYFCDVMDELNRAVRCRICPADTAKKWKEKLSCLDCR